jgi:hypothetical protein
MNSAPVTLCGVTMEASLCGALFIARWEMLVVADLHLEKGSGLARRGALLPPYDTRATLAALAASLDHYGARRVICLGDSFHDERAASRLSPADESRLRAMTGCLEWLWISGNHDGGLAGWFGGTMTEEVRFGPLVFRHQAVASTESVEISGHFHPKASVAVGGRTITARCFIGDEQRLILPSFGAFTGGINVLDPAIGQLFPGDFTAHLLGRGRVHSIARSRLTAPGATP